MWKNTEAGYGYVSKALHWFSALTVFGLFAAGFWMVELTYYSQWYKTVPHWHKSVGILLFIATLFRLLWRCNNISPKPLTSHSASQRSASRIVHMSIYLLLFLLMCSGYLISTADNRAIAVFNWFNVPALGALFANQADIAGLIHKYVAYALISLSVLHAIAAIKHHVIDKDGTLERMTH